MTTRDGVPIELRSFLAADAEAVDKILRELWGDDPAMFAVYRFMHREWPQGRALRQTLVAVVDGAVMGAGTLFENSLAPGRLMATINVVAGHQRRGVGSALFEALVGLGDSRPWLARVAPRRDPGGWAFLQARGFHPAIRTLTGRLDPDCQSVRTWISTLPATVPGYRIVDCDSPHIVASPAEVALAHAAIARQYHAWNPMIEIGAEQAVALFGGETVIPGSQLCVYAGNELVGAAHLIRHPFEPSDGGAFLVNFGVVGVDRPGTAEVTGALLRRCLEFAAERGLRVSFEVDDAYVPHWALFAAAPATEVSSDFVIMVNG